MSDPIPPLTELLFWPEGQQPWVKQEEAHQRSANERLFALLAEQRTGKTIVTLGKISHHYRRFLAAGGFGDPTAKESVLDLLPRRFVLGTQGKHVIKGGRLSDLPKAPSNPGMIYRPKAWATRGLDAMLVVAMPSGVPRNWAAEIALRVPKDLNPLALVWDADRADSVAFAGEFKALINHRGLTFFLINGEAIPTVLAKKAIGTFLRARRALAIGDETSLICSQPGNVRALVMEAIRKLPGAISRMILDGTPGDESPLDFFAQMSFLSRKLLGFESWVAFKTFFAEYEDATIWVKENGKPVQRAIKRIAVDETTGGKKFRNLDVLAERLAPVSFRVRRTDCFDIPDKVYVPWEFDLSAAQRAVYDPLREEFEAWLSDGKKVEARHVLARMTRLDQVASNFWPSEKVPAICGDCDGDGCPACGDVGAIFAKTAKRIIDPERNPRLDALAEVLSINPEPGIVWCVFDESVDAVLDLTTKLGRSPVRYDGLVGDDEKEANKLAFQRGHAGTIVAKEASAGRGLDLSAARWMAYFENKYSRRMRSQSEDRAEVAGRTFGTGVYDLLALDTYDAEKRAAHLSKGATSERVHEAIARARLARRTA